MYLPWLRNGAVLVHNYAEQNQERGSKQDIYLSCKNNYYESRLKSPTHCQEESLSDFTSENIYRWVFLLFQCSTEDMTKEVAGTAAVAKVEAGRIQRA